jgi:hypothetical protein
MHHYGAQMGGLAYTGAAHCSRPPCSGRFSKLIKIGFWLAYCKTELGGYKPLQHLEMPVAENPQ